MKKLIPFSILALTCVGFALAQVDPEDHAELEPLLGCYDTEPSFDKALSEIREAIDHEQVAGYAIYLRYAWNQDKLLVTFEEGASKEVKDGISKLLLKWNKCSRVQFEPSERPFEKGDVRVAFRKDYGNFSRIGRTAQDTPTTSPTMNLETCVKWPIGSKEFERVVLHEFGHALGFAHEHQHPNQNCSDEIDWPKAYNFYLSTQKWSQEQVDNNLQTIGGTQGMLLSAKGDLQSIMRYYLLPEILKENKKSHCYAAPTYTLSTGDKDGAALAYPKDEGFAPVSLIEEIYGLEKNEKLTQGTRELIKKWKSYWGKK